MAKLIALTPFADLLPITERAVRMTEVETPVLMSVAPFSGQNSAVSKSLKEQVGSGLPKPNRRVGDVTWFGHGVYLVAGDVALDGLAAVTVQTDAWAVLRIEGAGVEDVLSRVVPIDLRAGVFGKGHTAKTMLGHMSIMITRVGATAFEIVAMRSMAATVVHELHVATRGVAAR